MITKNDIGNALRELLGRKGGGDASVSLKRTRISSFGTINRINAGV